MQVRCEGGSVTSLVGGFEIATRSAATPAAPGLPEVSFASSQLTGLKVWNLTRVAVVPPDPDPVVDFNPLLRIFKRYSA